MSTDFLGSRANTNCEHLFFFFDSFKGPAELGPSVGGPFKFYYISCSCCSSGPESSVSEMSVRTTMQLAPTCTENHHVDRTITET